MKKLTVLSLILVLFLLTSCRVITKSDPKTYSMLTDIYTETVALLDKQAVKIDFKEDEKKLKSIISKTNVLQKHEETKGELNASTVKEINAFKKLLVLWHGEVKKEKEKNVKYFLKKQANKIKKQIKKAIENEKNKN